MVFMLSNGCNSSLGKILQFQTKVAELFGTTFVVVFDLYVHIMAY